MKSRRVERLEQGLLLLFIAVCCLMIALTLLFAFTEEGATSDARQNQQNPIYLAPTPTGS